MFGWIIPEPLHMPPIVTVFPPSSMVTATSLFFVSVVMIALEASVPLPVSPFNSGTMASIPLQIRSIGSCMPITPVDATNTSSAAMPNTFSTFSAVCLQ